ncbi:CopG family transcriptional regulator [Sulfolobales archaeon SCGC AB-777_J03]|nr:CopG family transcriptional regulator [Sulfolobales archaeon SCGC AB-777_J03]
MRIVSFKIEEELLMKLDVYALNKRLSRSDVIREALEKYLKEAAGGT